ncbi:SCO7613 C-terminal domain-containing membrane protein [Winogradskya consettensis]|uniref:SCO7613 C-terminal domain-containing membrane protein n=1 Tax=Winogradskya consettensis TaxID=113560 RepID=UPI001BB38947|nr:hypothetical protein [Actinoplanes consettensis]
MTAYPCPFCRAEASLATGCPGCGRGPDADAAEVVRLDAEIPVLTARLATAREAVGLADSVLRRAWRQRDAAATRVRAAVGAAVHAAPKAPAMTAPVTTAASERSAPYVAAAATEASTRLMQNTLFTLGGLLLAIAAIVFTAVAWSQFGLRGRVGLLAVATVVALAAPLFALRRKLTATAETFAAIGLLLVLLDGYAAWYVNLFGLADTSADGYAGAVFAVTAAIAAGYEQLTGLVGPRFAALVLAQPVLPLMVAPMHPGAGGWAYTLIGVAAGNLVVIHLRKGTLTVAAYTLGSIAVSIAALITLGDLVTVSTVAEAALSGSALVTAAGLVLTAAILARETVLRDLAAAALVVTLAIAGGRLASVAAGGFETPLLITLIVTLLAVTTKFLPASVRTGPRFGAAVALVLPVIAAALATLMAVAVGVSDWRLPAALVLLTIGVLALLPRLDVLFIGVVLLGLATPAGFGLVWWAAAPIDLALLAAALWLASSRLRWALGVAVVLAGHAIFVASASSGVTALTVGALAVAGVAVAWRRYWYAGPALSVAVLAVPIASWQAMNWFGWPPPVQSRVLLGVAALLVAATYALPRHRTFTVNATLLVIVTAPGWAWASGDSRAIYAAVGALLVAGLVRHHLDNGPAVTAGLLGAAYVSAAGQSLSNVYVLPYSRSGGPVGVTDAVGFGIIAVAVAAAVWQLWGRRAAAWATAPVVVLGVPVAVAAGNSPWPVLPMTSLVLGLGALVLAALGGLVSPANGALEGTESVRPRGRHATGTWRGSAPLRVTLAVAGVVAGGAGLTGSAATAATVLVAYGMIVVSGVVVGLAGRPDWTRVAGWLGAVVAAFAEAWVAARTLGLPLQQTAFVLLGVAALVLALGVIVRGEGRILQGAAHAGAVVALIISSGNIRYAAAVCTFWGLALGLRALVRDGRRAHVVAAAAVELVGGWLLLAAEQVAVVEAYTIPAAVLALLAGWQLRRSRLSSWTTYGPALAAALLPTLVTVLIQEGEPLRRLLLGLAALAITVAGAQFRLRAPVVAGGATLIVIALHEAILVWDLLPRWIPLALAGLLLVGLAMTLERRRRDVARLRAAITRMG